MVGYLQFLYWISLFAYHFRFIFNTFCSTFNLFWKQKTRRYLHIIRGFSVFVWYCVPPNEFVYFTLLLIFAFPIKFGYSSLQIPSFHVYLIFINFYLKADYIYCIKVISFLCIYWKNSKKVNIDFFTP